MTYVDAGYTVYNQFQGAELFVPAQPGLTNEWLQRVLTEQVATGACDFGVPSARVSVLSAGGGFSGARQRSQREGRRRDPEARRALAEVTPCAKRGTTEVIGPQRERITGLSTLRW